MIRERLEGYTWASDAMLAAELDLDGVVLRANPAFERRAARALTGVPIHELVASAQLDALARHVAAADGDWRSGMFAVQIPGSGAAADRCVWVRRVGDTVLLVAEPAVGEQEHLVEKVLELNDDLVAAHRALVHQREELHESADRIANLEAISAAGLADLRLDELIGQVLGVIVEAVGVERAVLLLLDEDEQELVGAAAVGLDAEVLDDVRVPIGAGVAGRIAATGEPVLIGDLSTVETYSAYLRESRSMAGVPLQLDGSVIGVLHVTAGVPDRFGEDDLRLLMPAAERAALVIGRARVIERERRIAETLQRALLPDTLPAVPGLRLAARFTPGAGVEVGGDWYDALPLEDGRLAVVIGDVAGKGLRAATLMGELRAGLRAYAIEGGEPHETLARLNRMAERSGHMATAVLAHVSPDAERLTFASAGHLPPLQLDRDGHASFLEGGASAPLLAYREGVAPAHASLAPGSRVVLYTDGLVERRREPIDESLERLRRVAAGFEGDVEALCDHLMTAMAPPAGTPHDDVALIAMAREI